MIRANRLFTRGFVTLIMVCVALSATFIMLPDGSLAETLVLVATMAAAATIVIARLHREHLLTTLPWNLLAVSVVFYAVLTAIWASPALLARQAEPFGMTIDLLSWASHAGFGAFLVCVLKRRYAEVRSVRRPIVVILVDAAIFAIAVTSIVWVAIALAGPSQRLSQPLTAVTAAAYILVSTMLLGVAVRLAASTDWAAKVDLLLLGWIGFAVVADVAYGYLMITTGYHFGHPASSAWMVSSVTLAAAARQRDFVALDRARATFTDARWNVWAPLAVALLPLVMVLIYRSPLMEILAAAAILLNIARLRLLFLDLSHQQQVANELAQTVDDLASANKSLEHFAAVVSHDLRSPLATTQGLLETLAARSDELSDNDRMLVERAVGLTSAQIETIEALLTLSRASQQPINRQPVDIAMLLREVLAQLRDEIDATQATIKLGDLPTVGGDPTLLRILFQNLITNALKFRHPDRHPFVTVHAVPNGQHWDISVADNGRGFDPADVEAIFALFGRSQEGYKVPGSGIGLATCRRIARQHNGEIFAQSRDNGATLTVMLPAS